MDFHFHWDVPENIEDTKPSEFMAPILFMFSGLIRKYEEENHVLPDLESEDVQNELTLKILDGFEAAMLYLSFMFDLSPTELLQKAHQIITEGIASNED